MSRPGIVGMRGPMVIRLRPRIRSSTSLLSSTRPSPPPRPPFVSPLTLSPYHGRPSPAHQVFYLPNYLLAEKTIVNIQRSAHQWHEFFIQVRPRLPSYPYPSSFSPQNCRLLGAEKQSRYLSGTRVVGLPGTWLGLRMFWVLGGADDFRQSGRSESVLSSRMSNDLLNVFHPGFS